MPSTSPWEKSELIIENKLTKTTAPVILSASRRTDIPAWGAEEFMNQWQKGYFWVKNPYNPLIREAVLTKNVRVIVFWTKDPEKMLPHLKYFEESGIGTYFLYTLNDYEKEGLEPGLASLPKRIDTFKRLSGLLGSERNIWRFDPVILTSDNENLILERLQNIARNIAGFTNRCIFSFLDIGMYASVRNRMERQGFNIPLLTEEQQFNFAEKMKRICDSSGMTLSSCAEELDFTNLGIPPSSCIDAALMRKAFAHDKKLMAFLDKPQGKLKDQNQRKECKCIWSKDIGAYNTCRFNCTYCYAKR